MGSGKGKTRRAQATSAGKVTREGTFQEPHHGSLSTSHAVKYRYKNRHWEVEREVEIDKPFLDSLEAWVARLQETTAGLTEATIELIEDYDYYGEKLMPQIIVGGWRNANSEEVEAIKESRKPEKPTGK
jgi:uncharacterized protein YifN (PemK superfamily)